MGEFTQMTTDALAEEHRIVIDKLHNQLIGKYPERQPSQDELSFFYQRPEVAGYAADDRAVVVSPFNDVGRDQMKRKSLLLNERLRQYMKDNQVNFDFDIEPDQLYSAGPEYQENPTMLRETIVSRILSGDPSLEPYSLQQKEAAKQLVRRILQ